MQLVLDWMVLILPMQEQLEPWILFPLYHMLK